MWLKTEKRFVECVFREERTVRFLVRQCGVHLSILAGCYMRIKDRC